MTYRYAFSIRGQNSSQEPKFSYFKDRSERGKRMVLVKNSKDFGDNNACQRTIR